MTGTPVGPQRCLDLVRGVCNPSPQERRVWADVVSTWSGWGELDAHEVDVLAWVLGWAAVVETHRFEVREGLLLSLSDLASGGRVPSGVLDLVATAIAPGDVHVAEEEMYAALVAARSGREPLAAAAAGASLGPAPCLDLVRRIAAASSGERRSGAALTAGRAAAGELDDDEARTLAAVLVWAVEVETTPARPALLSPLTVMAERDHVPAWALDRVLARLDESASDRAEESFRTELLAALRRIAG